MSQMKLVNKLESKLSQYVRQETEAHKMLKILKQLSTIEITLEILQATRIGKTVNTLRKRPGEVGEKSKTLVQRWKQLIPMQHSAVVVQPLLHNVSLNNGMSTTDNNARGNVTNHMDDVTRHIVASSPESLGQRKRKSGANIEDSDTIALTKRSRTQVYSGRSIGMKYVPSLFDMCMNILETNIDAIYEVGGIPFFILEPVLIKCTPTQLMRLEELNPHFLEDSDCLWQKHTQKQFRDARPEDGQSWRDLYLEKLASREEKMKSITSSIKARQEARQEPVRKAAVLSSLAPPPPRRARGGYSRKPFTPGASSSSGSNLMKRTLRMAKDRRLMMSSRRGRK